MVFIDHIEKAYGVPRQDDRRYMMEKGVSEMYARRVQYMYEEATTPAKSSLGVTDKIPVGVRLHQGSSLRPYLFAMIMDVSACGIKDLSRGAGYVLMKLRGG